MHAILSLLIGCYPYSAICIRITILNSRAPPLTIVGRAHGSARAYAPRHVCSTVHAPPRVALLGGARTPVKVGRCSSSHIAHVSFELPFYAAHSCAHIINLCLSTMAAAPVLVPLDRSSDICIHSSCTIVPRN